MPAAGGYQAVADRARGMGLTLCDASRPPAGTVIAKAEWPGVRLTPGPGDASSGPTGAPWIDSNGWLVRLTRMQQDAGVWLAAEPPESSQVFPAARHLVAIADSAAHGGRWIITLDDDLATGLAAGNAEKRAAWRSMMRACAFFDAHAEWNRWDCDATLAVVAAFAGEDEFFSREVLNLLARTSVSYTMLDPARLTASVLQGFRGVLYVGAAPMQATRQLLLAFVERGGLLITAPNFGGAPGQAPAELTHPRYDCRSLGKGTIAMAREALTDPYEVAQDAQILLSHRYDLLRFYNGFLLGGYLAHSPDGKRRLAHIVNYAGAPPEDPPSAWIAGRYHSAKLWSVEEQSSAPAQWSVQRGGAEVHLPLFPVYGGIELEIG